MIIDQATSITGSFDFTKAAEEKNAENLLVIKGDPGLVKKYLANSEEHLGTPRNTRDDDKPAWIHLWERWFKRFLL